jgi:Neocarzinostatin family
MSKLAQSRRPADTPTMVERARWGAGLALAAWLAAAAPVAASNQTITVTPATGLQAQQTVHLTAAGFKPGTLLVITECADRQAATGPDDCDLPHEQLVRANSAGVVEASYRANPGVFAPHRIDCTVVQCVISVSELTFDPSQQASADISFAPGVHVVPAAGSGSSSAQNAGNLSIDWVIPVLAAIVWLICIGLRPRLRPARHLAAAGFIFIGVACLQSYAWAASALIPSRVSSATIYSLYFIALEAAALLYLVLGHLRIARGHNRWLRAGDAAVTVLLCGGVLWVGWIAAGTMAQSSAGDGGGPIWYSAAGVCAAGAVWALRAVAGSAERAHLG